MNAKRMMTAACGLLIVAGCATSPKQPAADATPATSTAPATGTAAAQPTPPLPPNFAPLMSANKPPEPSDGEKMNQTVNELARMTLGLMGYRIDNGKYPASPDIVGLKEALSTYIENIPQTDPWGTPYRYIPSADGQSFTLASAGADKEFKTELWETKAEFDDPKHDVVVKDSELWRSPSKELLKQ